MTSIEYMGVKIEAPTHWGEITVNDYEEVQMLPCETIRDKVAIAARLCRVTDSLLLDWPTQAFEAIVDSISFLWGNFEAKPCPSVIVKGVKYVVSIDQALTLGEWIDADEAQKSGERIFSRLLAVVCRPAGEAYDSDRNEKRAAMFAGLPADQIQGVVAFFFAIRKEIKNDYRGLFENSGGSQPIAPEYRALATRWGWYKVIADLANHKILDFDKVTALPARQVFAFLSFEREKTRAEAAQRAYDRQIAKGKRNGGS